MSLCNDCISGVRHEGETTGKIEKIAGVEVYISIPEGEYAKDKAILYLPDAFGLPLSNAQLMVDDFARNGFQVYLIDLFDGDPVPADVLNVTTHTLDPKFDRVRWIQKHDVQATRPKLDAVIAALKERDIKEFGATGYCFGGKFVFNLAQENIIKAAVASHPSLLQIPEDLEKLLAQSEAPLLINSCDVDHQFPAESCATADTLLGAGKYAPGYKRVHWPGCTHGFAVRGDLDDPKVKAGKEGSFAETVAWFKKHL